MQDNQASGLLALRAGGAHWRPRRNTRRVVFAVLLFTFVLLLILSYAGRIHRGRG
jgi:hypothetical protein